MQQHPDVVNGTVDRSVTLALPNPFEYVQERSNQFLALFPHRHDYIYARHPSPGKRPQWQTESRHPLSDRLIEQGTYLYGVRFGKETQYAMLDIDIGSAYHPRRDPIAFQKLTEALEPLGLVSAITCTSSDSQGLHLYFPFSESLTAWEVGSGVTLLLESQGFKVTPGQLEVFPNARLYTIESTPNLFNAHRLPLQRGSYLLNDDLEPIWTDQTTFVEQWRQCQSRNNLSNETLQQIIKQKKRRSYRLSNKADKFLNDLNAEIEQGWTDHGQTNRLLGRITMRTYVFHHVMYGGEPLTGDSLIKEVLTVAQALPGYELWCRHQHEIEDRVSEWVSCIEKSHYFHYGEQFRKYKSKKERAESENTEPSWNQQQSQKTKDKIQAALKELSDKNELPEQATARFNALRKFGIGGGSLYRYKELWHPLWKSQKKSPQTPQCNNESGQFGALAWPNCHSSTSLLQGIDGNNNEINGSSDLKSVEHQPEGGNSHREEIQRIREMLSKAQVAVDLQAAQEVVKAEEMLAQESRAAHLQRMAYWLTLDDPILMTEALAWLRQQPSELCAELLDTELSELQQQALETIVETVEQLQRLDWGPGRIQEELRSQFSISSLAHLTAKQRQQWLSYLRSRPDTG
ncbi:hypothetical protein Lepto7375DRAFT_0798 [Leptolyngbya sp. PCC 7375]|nr:hypothetical protein Lepto7375DRAFT_0798 [Leptolyngbya sp. PCC 7375]